MFDVHGEPRSDGSLMVKVSGTIQLPTAIEFQDKTIKILNNYNTYKKIIFDLSQVEKLDNTGLGVLVHLSTVYTKQGRQLALFRPTTDIQQLIKDVGIEKFFPIFETRQELKNYSMSDMR